MASSPNEVNHANLPGIDFAINGKGEIRTPDDPGAIPVFETGPFNRSGTFPLGPIVADAFGWVNCLVLIEFISFESVFHHVF